MCPAHAAWDQKRRLREKFGARACEDGFPFFPDRRGRQCSKEAVAATFVEAAKRLGVPTETPDGAERVSGHTLRVTGAQGMARAGLDVWAIQLLGRWGSDAVNTYLREAQLAASATWASRAASNKSLEEVVKDIMDQRMAVAECGLAARPMKEQGTFSVDVSEALDHEVAAAAPAEVEPQLVASQKGVWHAVLLAADVSDPELAVTFCGWRFGGSPHTLHDMSALPRNPKVICAKCLPAKRASLKDELALVARSVG